MARVEVLARDHGIMSVETTTAVVARIRDARAARAPLRIAGAGTWLDAGAPCSARERLDLAALAGIVEYEPGDLTLTARAGTRLADVQRATAAHGQWLTLDPVGWTEGTLGATIATGAYGPLAAAFGTPRNQVLGCELVSGTGDVIRAGGRVVKNVAGFDITRLMVGAWGTLGVITEVTVRLRARPEADETIAIALGTTEGVDHARRWLRTTEFTPFAAELVSPSFAAQLGMPTTNADLLLLRLGGNSALVRAARHAAADLGDVMTPAHDVWAALANASLGGSDAATFRLSTAPARVAPLWHAARHVIEGAGGMTHATLGRGVVRCVLPMQGGDDGTHLRGVLAALPTATRIAERMPPAAWGSPAADPVSSSLVAGVRRVFDPDQLLNPGIMGTA